LCILVNNDTAKMRGREGGMDIIKSLKTVKMGI